MQSAYSLEETDFLIPTWIGISVHNIRYYPILRKLRSLLNKFFLKRVKNTYARTRNWDLSYTRQVLHHRPTQIISSLTQIAYLLVLSDLQPGSLTNEITLYIWELHYSMHNSYMHTKFQPEVLILCRWRSELSKLSQQKEK